ncbi:hypothetical protein NDU88_007579 [Pleurodeles waltl]|uniref:Uncharacterized protein n=1 Tax=Pleurodeles waltl TaxID=8319 RepID=A0AAV7RPU8_PLEWA|nr:hypothetical protein NDU88_007579 [Pleurodeles waltl]
MAKQQRPKEAMDCGNSRREAKRCCGRLCQIELERYEPRESKNGSKVEEEAGQGTPGGNEPAETRLERGSTSAGWG